MADTENPRFGAAEWRSLGSLGITLVVMAALLFWSAGSIGWTRGWWYLAVFAAAIAVARRLGPGHVVATILCDGGARYQSKLFNPEFLRGKGLPVPPWMQ